jgi:membrane associated rhomboid family serine protease
MQFFRFTPVITNIILFNVAILIIMSISGSTIPIFHRLFALYYSESPNFSPTQYFTYMFLHADIGHLFSNMFGLLIFGPLLEDFWGAKRLITYYLLCGLGAGIIYSGLQYYENQGMKKAMQEYLENPTPANYSYFFYEYGRNTYSEMLPWIDEYRENPENRTFIEQGRSAITQFYAYKINVPMVGASGALFGVLIAFGLLFPNSTPFIIPIPAKFIVGIYGITAYYGVIKNDPGDYIAHSAHLGGMIVGFFIVKYWQRQRNKFY